MWQPESRRCPPGPHRHRAGARRLGPPRAGGGRPHPDLRARRRPARSRLARAGARVRGGPASFPISCFLRPAAARADVVRTGVAFPVMRGDTLLAVCELFSPEARGPARTARRARAPRAGRSASSSGGCGRSRRSGSSPTPCSGACCPRTCPRSPVSQVAARYRPGPAGRPSSAATPTTSCRCRTARWMVLIADVCGTGAEAAAVTALTRHTARAAPPPAGNPGEVLRAGQHRPAARAGRQVRCAS